MSNAGSYSYTTENHPFVVHFKHEGLEADFIEYARQLEHELNTARALVNAFRDAQSLGPSRKQNAAPQVDQGASKEDVAIASKPSSPADAADAARYRFWRRHDWGIEAVIDGRIRSMNGAELDEVTDHLIQSTATSNPEKDHG